MNSGHVRVSPGRYGHLFKLFHHCRSDIYGHLIQIFTTMDWTFMGTSIILPPWIGHLGAFDLSFISTIGFHLWPFVAIILPP